MCLGKPVSGATVSFFPTHVRLLYAAHEKVHAGIAALDYVKRREIAALASDKCDGLLTPELIKYPKLEPDWHYSLFGDGDRKEGAGIIESIDITPLTQNTSRQSMVVYAKSKAWDLNPHRLQYLEMTQTEASSPMKWQEGDDMLPLLNSDSDWNLVESDSEDECIFPYSPNASVMDWESKTTSTPQCVGIDIFDESTTVAQDPPIHSGQMKPSTEPPQDLTRVVPRPFLQ
ncbi:hypothetical protein V492_00387 [Pseudogymnoascus sp. VKM F-4246]|nr:hypothetical protein V492_00387 [Pseudogymnoascus sp. VKM F-4246]